MDESFDAEIRDAFLVEAKELVERLSDQLVNLEKEPRDSELLNAVFRAFHTVKGGAGFLAIEPMVMLCHNAEDLLNVARTGKVLLDATHMDALLEALDLLMVMLEALATGGTMQMPPAALLQRLTPQLVRTPTPAAPVVVAPTSSNNTIDDDEFESMLDDIYGRGGTPGAAPASEISDDEFESLLDALHGAPTSAVETVESQPAVSNISASAETTTAVASKAGAAPPDTSVRVDITRLDALVNRAGELVLVRNRLLSLASKTGDVALAQAVNQLDRVSDSLQEAVLGMRLQPVGRLFQRFPRIVRDLSRQLGKEVELVLEGEGTNLDRSLVEGLSDPLVHLIRNALDHGLEMPDERERAGKSSKGRVVLSASQRGERIVITVSDDGRGMNPDVLRRKAVEKGVIDEAQAARMTDEESYELIFRPGFSTAATVSDISGRGVGMDVVKTRIAELGGTLHVQSRLGHGSELQLAVPLTMAIQRVLMVRVGTRLLAMPLINVDEVFELQPGQEQLLDGYRVANHRGRALPLANIAAWLRLGIPAGRHVAVVSIGHVRLGCLVDGVLGREDVMVKPLGALFEGIQAIAGATVTGDGRLALVLDLAGLTGNDGQLISSLRVNS